MPCRGPLETSNEDMNVNLPRKYFLSRKVALNAIDVCHYAKGAPVVRRPAVAMDRCVGECIHKLIPSDNGHLLIFYGKSYNMLDFSAKTFCEKEGAMEASDEYVVKYNCEKKELLAQNFTNDLKYAFVLRLSERSGGFFKSSKSELFLNVAKFHKVVREGENVNSFYNAVFEQELLILKRKKRMPRVLSTCVSPKGNYLCLIFDFHEILESHLFIYNIDFENNSASFERLVKMCTLSCHDHCVQLEMNENESLVLITYTHYHPALYVGTPQIKAVFYSFVDNLIHEISLRDSESVLICCCSIDHVIHGYLIFMLEYNRNQDCVVEILKYKRMTFERLAKINMTEEFGLPTDVDGFVVQGVIETRMFLSYSVQLYVIDVFSRTLVYVIDPDVCGHIYQFCVNWNGQEIFIVREELDWRSELVLQCYYLPRKDEFSLRHTAAISVMATYSASYLKSLNLPKILKCLLNIA